MARKGKLESFEDRVAAQWLDEAEQVADQIAAEAGPPPGGDHISEPEAIRLYGQVDQRVDYDQILEMLQTTGVPEEMLQALEIARERPEWAPLYAQPQQDPRVAQILATFAEYPWRPGLVLDYSDSPVEQVKRDETLFRGWQKEIAAADAQADEMLAGPMPMMRDSQGPMPMMEQMPPPAPMAPPTAAPPVPSTEEVPYGR